MSKVLSNLLYNEERIGRTTIVWSSLMASGVLTLALVVHTIVYMIVSIY